jgi:hypothetical protein
MISEKFSVREFEARGRNSEASNDLSSALQAAIAETVRDDVRALAEKVAKRLTELGHRMTETSFEVDPGGMASVTFVDLSAGEAREAHRLRFTLDLVVSAGFPGYSIDETDEEVSGLTRFDPHDIAPRT